MNTCPLEPAFNGILEDSSYFSPCLFLYTTNVNKDNTVVLSQRYPHDPFYCYHPALFDYTVFQLNKDGI